MYLETKYEIGDDGFYLLGSFVIGYGIITEIIFTVTKEEIIESLKIYDSIACKTVEVRPEYFSKSLASFEKFIKPKFPEELSPIPEGDLLF